MFSNFGQVLTHFGQVLTDYNFRLTLGKFGQPLIDFKTMFRKMLKQTSSQNNHRFCILELCLPQKEATSKKHSNFTVKKILVQKSSLLSSQGVKVNLFP